MLNNWDEPFLSLPAKSLARSGVPVKQQGSSSEIIPSAYRLIGKLSANQVVRPCLERQVNQGYFFSPLVFRVPAVVVCFDRQRHKKAKQTGSGNTKCRAPKEHQCSCAAAQVCYSSAGKSNRPPVQQRFAGSFQPHNYGAVSAGKKEELITIINPLDELYKGKSWEGYVVLTKQLNTKNEMGK